MSFASHEEEDPVRSERSISKRKRNLSTSPPSLHLLQQENDPSLFNRETSAKKEKDAEDNAVVKEMVPEVKRKRRKRAVESDSLLSLI